MVRAEYDAAILLGGGVNLDGSLATSEQVQVEKAVDMHRDSQVGNLIVCGAYGYKSDDRPGVTEARAYETYALQLGVSQNNIKRDEMSWETSGSMYFAKKILIENNWQNAVIFPAINHLTVRVVYAATKILGPDYSWSIQRAHQNMSVRNVMRELRSLALTKAIQDSIEDGDHEMVYQKLCETHPAYGGSIPLETLKTQLSLL